MNRLRYSSLFLSLFSILILSLASVACGNGIEGGGGPPAEEPDGEVSIPIVHVDVEDHISYRLMHPVFPQYTGDLWPSAWGEDDRLYTANGDGFGFGWIFTDIVFSVIEGIPPNLAGRTPLFAGHAFIAAKWGPRRWEVSRKPTGMVCVDGDIYLFYQNLKNAFSDNAFGDAPHASISVTRDKGRTWEVGRSEPMFTDHVFTTGFFLDYGKCQEHAIDEYIYVYGLDYNYRYSEGFDQTKMYLARVHRESILDREAWEFFTGLDRKGATWSSDIEERVPVLEDEELYWDDKSGIAQGSVVYFPQWGRYLYSTRAYREWIFYEAGEPWGPWAKITVQEWMGGWSEDWHAGYNAVIPSKYLDEDGLGGWIMSSLSWSYFDGMYYNMGLRRFTLEVEDGR